jgi:hypothetical protein
VKGVAFWLLALLLAVFGAACVVFPLLMLAPVDPGAHLLDDTRAAFGGGRPAGITVSRVACVRGEYGHDSTGSRGIHSIEYDCEFEVQRPADTAPAAEPDWAGMTYEERREWERAADARYSEYLRELVRSPGPNDPPRVLRRQLPASAQGRPLPAVRQFTPDGVPPRYGLVWPDGGLGRRWFRWAWETAIFWTFAVGCFVAIPALRRKLR